MTTLPLFTIVILSTFVSLILGSPVASSKRSTISSLSANEIAGFSSYTYYASAGYCKPAMTKSWSCGANCKAISGFQTTASGGNGNDIQYWFVGYDQSLNTVIVVHQGTYSLIADFIDVDFFPKSLDSTLFPGVDPSIKVHSGFAGSHSRSAKDILSAVQTTLSAHPDASVTLIGHSLGAALALLDSVYLALHLPASTIFKTIGYGMPRVGNQAFADYVDAHVSDLTHVNNKKDPVPIVPGRGLGFHHPKGEVHIQSSGAWMSCPGQDNASGKCIVGEVPNILFSDVLDHLGPYNGIYIGC